MTDILSSYGEEALRYCVEQVVWSLWSHYSTAASRYWRCETDIMPLCLPTGKGALKYCVEQLRLFEMWLYLMCWLCYCMKIVCCIWYVTMASLHEAWGLLYTCPGGSKSKDGLWSGGKGGYVTVIFRLSDFIPQLPFAIPRLVNIAADPSSLCEEPACEISLRLSCVVIMSCVVSYLRWTLETSGQLL